MEIAERARGAGPRAHAPSGRASTPACWSSFARTARRCSSSTAAGWPSGSRLPSTSSPGEPLVRSHHGSIARPQRIEIEDALKAGQLRALVATSSLELGIDMGAIDLVVQIEAPPSVASGLQRIGRAGPPGRAASAKASSSRSTAATSSRAPPSRARCTRARSKSTRYPRNPLDVLAQQLVAMVAVEPWDADDLFARVRCAAPFEALARRAFDGVLDMLSGRYPSDEFAELRPRLTWDRAVGHVDRAGRREARGDRQRRHHPRSRAVRRLPGRRRPTGTARVGELDEEMVFESRVGETFLLGASSWRIEEITHDRVLVSPAPGEPGKMPFWKGDGPGRPRELGLAIGTARARAPPHAAGRRRGAARARARSRPARRREPPRLPDGPGRGGRRGARRPDDRRRAHARRTGRLARLPALPARRPRAHALGARRRRSDPRTGRRRRRGHVDRRWLRGAHAGHRHPRRHEPAPAAVRRGRAAGRSGSSGRARSSLRSSARSRGARSCCRAAGPGSARRCGSSGSGPRTCWRSRRDTARFRRCSRRTASASATSSTCRRSSTRCARSSRVRCTWSPWTRASRRRSPPRCSSGTSPTSCTTATRRSPNAAPRPSRSITRSCGSCSARRSSATCSTWR